MNRNILILGGARSGKSTYAQRMAEEVAGKVIFVATAEALDVDMRARIEKHKAERPSSWRTIEASIGVASALDGELSGVAVVLIDDITLLVSNILLGDGRGFSEPDSIDAESVESKVVTEMQALVDLMSFSDARFLIVSNELGLGVVPENRLARLYRDILGRANQLLAQHVDEVCLMVAGIPVKVKG